MGYPAQRTLGSSEPCLAAPPVLGSATVAVAATGTGTPRAQVPTKNKSAFIPFDLRPAGDGAVAGKKNVCQRYTRICGDLGLSTIF